MNDEPRRPAVRLKLLGPIVLVAAGLCLLLVIVVPGLRHSSWVSNERVASTELKRMATLEAEFRQNDLDGNRVNDYWTGDVKGMYSMTSAAVRGNKRSPEDRTLQLPMLNVALADVDRTMLPAGGENTAMTDYGNWGPSAGYWYAAMTRDDLRDPKVMGDPVYRQDTGGEPPMGRVHHLHRFGFVAFPATRKAGGTAYIVNPNGVVYGLPVLDKGFGPDFDTPPSLDQLPPEYLNWPSEADLKKGWAKLE